MRRIWSPQGAIRRTGPSACTPAVSRNSSPRQTGSSVACPRRMGREDDQRQAEEHCHEEGRGEPARGNRGRAIGGGGLGGIDGPENDRSRRKSHEGKTEREPA